VEVVTLAPFPSAAVEEVRALTSAVAALKPQGGAVRSTPERPKVRPKEISEGEPIDALGLASEIVRAQIPGDIVVDEGRTGVGPYFSLANAAPKHRYLGHTGGAIGEGMPLAIGAALADPQATVVVIQADGGGMYAPQALWTMAREQLDIKVVVVSNRAYRILQIELHQSGLPLHGRAKDLTSLSNPSIGWVDLARGSGVPGLTVDSITKLRAALKEARSFRGPFLLDVEISERT
jgi:acetolactate synthase-1/2/3 large subunit